MIDIMDMSQQERADWIEDAQRKIASDRAANRAAVRAYEAENQRIVYESQMAIQQMMAEMLFNACAANRATSVHAKAITVAM